MPDGRTADAELNRLWNALVDDAGDPDITGEAPFLAETLRRVHAMTLAPPPAAARARVNDGMRALLAAPSNGKGAVDPHQVRVLVHAPHQPLNPWQPDTGVEPPAAPRAAARFGWAAMQMATALLVLLTLGFAFLLATPGRLDGQIVAAIRSVFAPETALDTVFATTLPAEMIPEAGNLDFLLWNVSLDPGAEGPASAQSWTQTRICCPGPMITHVIEGELSVRVDGPLRVFRGSGVAPDSGDVPPGTEVALSPGDTALFAYDMPATFANRGTSAVHIVGGGIFAGAVRNGPAAQSDYLDYNEEYSVPRLPPGPVDVTLARATLPAEGEVPAPDPGGLVLEVGAAGDADIAKRADGGLRNIGPEPETIYVLTLTPAGAAGAETP